MTDTRLPTIRRLLRHAVALVLLTCACPVAMGFAGQYLSGPICTGTVAGFFLLGCAALMGAIACALGIMTALTLGEP